MSFRLILSCIGLLSLGGCQMILGPHLEGSGNAITQERAVGSFTELYVSDGGSHHVLVGPPTSVMIEVDDNLQENTLTNSSGETLKISTRYRYSSDIGLHTEISTPELNKLNVTGSGEVNVESLNAMRFEASVTGSGDLTANGAVQDLVVTVTGSGSVDLSDVVANSVKVSITGSGSVKVFAIETLDVNITGSGDVEYLGSPKLQKSITGSGDISQSQS